MGWRDTVKDAVYDMLCSTFGVDPEAKSSLNRFVPAYTDNVTSPQYNSNDNVCFYAISEEQGTSVDYVAEEVDAQNQKILITSNIPITLLLSFYGPNAYDDAEYFWSRAMVDNGYGSPRSILRQNSIAYRDKPVRPITANELEGTLWRYRCDVRVPLVYLNVDQVDTVFIEEPPEVILATPIDQPEGS